MDPAPAPEDQNLDIEDEFGERVVVKTEEGELGSSEEEGEVAGCCLADSLGNRGDREKKCYKYHHKVLAVLALKKVGQGAMPLVELWTFFYFFFLLT